jgi:hypothetical protein
MADKPAARSPPRSPPRAPARAPARKAPAYPGGFPGPASPDASDLRVPMPPPYPTTSYPMPSAPPPGAPGNPPPGWGYPYPPPMQWQQVQPSLWSRIPETMKQLLKSYLLVLAGALVLVGLLFVIDLFFPFGGERFVARAFGTFFTLILGWGWGIFGAFMMFYKPMRPAGAAGLAVGVAFIVFGSLAVWEFTTYELWNIPWALFWIQVALAAGMVGWLKLEKGTDQVVAIVTIALTFLCGLVMAIYTLDLTSNPDDRYPSAAFSLGLGVSVASTFTLLPPLSEYRLARWLAYAAPFELGLVGAVHPWLTGEFQDRWAIVGWVVAAILLLIGATAYIIAKLRPEPAQA